MQSNGIQIDNTPNIIVITDSDQNQITVTQPIVNVIEVSTPGPQGQPGATGPQGPSGSLQPNSTGSFEITGSLLITGSNPLTVIGPTTLSGSLNVTQGITGSLFGTSSYGTNALSASYALTASYASNVPTTASYALTASVAVSSSYSLTASYVNPLVQEVIITGSLTVSGSSTFTNIGPAIFSGSVNITGSTVALQGGSFSGSGANLFNIPASGITGLNLSQIATGSISASVSTGTGSFTVSSGSTSFLFVSSSGNVGIGTTTPSRLLHVAEGGTRLYQTFKPGVPTLYVYHGRVEFDSTVRFENGSGDNLYFGGAGLFVTGNTTIGNGNTSLSARLAVKGSGATSATTSFLVQNSSGTDLFKITDGGFLTVGRSTPPVNFDINLGGSLGIRNSSPSSDVIASYNSSTLTFYVNALGTVRSTAQMGLLASALGTIDVSAKFQIDSTTQGFLLPRTNLTSNISTPAQGLQTYITASATEGIYYYNSGSYQGWTRVLNNTGSQSISGSLELTSALTASSAIISGNVTVLGTASINTLIVNQTQLSTGSNQLGDAADDFQTLYGTVRIPTGSLTITGSVNITGSAGAITVGRATSTVGLVHIQKPANSTLANLYLATPYPSTTPTSIIFQNNDFGGGATGTGSINWDVTGNYFNISNRVLLGAGQTSIDLTPGSLITLSRVGAGDLQLNFLQGGVASYVIRNVSGQKALAFITDGVTTTTAEAARFTANSNFLVGTTSDVARVVVRGSGATSSTTALLVQNSNASSSLAVLDNGNVGIGTASPTTPLTINKPGSNNFFNFEPSATGTAPYLQAFYQGIVDTRIYFDNSFKFRQGGSTIPWGIDAGAIQGTSLLSIGPAGSQGSLLLVGSSGNASAVYFWESGISYRGALGFSGSSADFQIITNLPGPTTFSGNERLRIFGATGNVAIGTSTDSGFKLDVSGSGNFTNNLTITGSLTVITGSTVEFQVNQTGVKIGNATTDSHSITGSVAISASAGTGSALTVYKSGSTVVDIQGSSGQLFSVTDSLTGSLFSVNTVAGLPVMEAFSDNTVNIGKFGVYPIKVVSLGTSAVVSGSFSGSGADLSGIPASAIVGLNLSRIATGSVSASVGLGTGSFSIVSGSSNFLFVSSSGNVGIGTSTPTAKLQIKGTGDSSVWVTTDDFNSGINAGSVVRIGTRNSSGNTQGWIDVLNSGVSSYGNLIIGGFGGNILIGTTTDSGFKFDVNGTGRFSGNLTISGSATNSLTVKGSGATSSTTALLVQNSAGTQSGYIDDSGQWMIGTGTNGGYRLDISGSTRIQGDTTIGLGTTGVINNLTFQSARGGAGLRAGIYWSSGASIINRRKFSGGNDNTLSFSVGISPIELLTIQEHNGTTSTNNVGINNTSPNVSAVLDIVSTTQGLLLPRTNLTSNINTPAQGLQTYITSSTSEGLYYYNSGSYQGWTRVLNNTGSQSISGSIIIDGGLFDTLSTGSLATGSTLLYSVNTGSYAAGFFDYYAISGSNGRSGTIMSFWLGGQVQYNDNSTPDVGDTSNIAFSMSLAGANAQLFASASSAGWNVKTTFRTI